MLAAILVLTACGETPPTDLPTPPPEATSLATDTPTSTDSKPTPTDNDLSFLIRHGVRSPLSKAPGTIRLATYNVENLFDDIDDPALGGRNDDIDETIPIERRQPLADAIRAADADILCLQEIESESALRWYMDEYLTGMGYDHVVSIDAGDERGIEQAVLSRFPIAHVENWPRRPLAGVHPDNWGDQENWHAGEPILFHRSPLRVDVEVTASEDGEPYRLTLYVIHQKSNRYGGYWREAEANGLIEILYAADDLTDTTNIAILGDFNATVDQPSVRTYLDFGFHDAFAGLSGAAVITHASSRRIDLILVNDALRPEVIDASRFVLGTIQRPADMSWQDPAPPGYAADHYPVVVDLHPSDR